MSQQSEAAKAKLIVAHTNISAALKLLDSLDSPDALAVANRNLIKVPE